MKTARTSELVTITEKRKPHENSLVMFGINDLASKLSNPNDFQKVEQYMQESQDKVLVAVLRNLLSLVTYMKVSSASSAEMLSALTSSFLSTSADDLISNPLRSATEGIVSKTPKIPALEVIELPSFWKDANNTLAIQTLESLKSPKSDALGIKFNNTSGDQETFLYWTKDDIVKSPHIFDLTSITLS